MIMAGKIIKKLKIEGRSCNRKIRKIVNKEKL